MKEEDKELLLKDLCVRLPYDSDNCKSIEFFDRLNAHHFDYRGFD